MRGSVRKRGDKWYYSFEAARVNGKRNRIERVGGKTKAEAERKLAFAIAEYERSGQHFEASEMSVADYLDYWLENYVKMNCKHNTINNYETIIRKHLKPALGKYKLKSLTSSVLQELINDKYIAGFSKNHISNIKNVLSGSMKKAVHPYKFIDSNPMEHVRLPKKNNQAKTSKNVLSKKDIQRIFDRFPFGSNLHMPLLLHIILAFVQVKCVL